MIDENKIIKELCDQEVGFRQLARITGISYGIIQRVVTDQSPLIYSNLSEDRNTASPKSSSRKGRRYRKASIAIFHLNNIRRCDPFTLCQTFKKATKSTLKKRFPIKKFGRFNKMHYLCTHENPPSLFTMLKSAGRFIFLWHIIQRPTHRPPN